MKLLFYAFHNSKINKLNNFGTNRIEAPLLEFFKSAEFHILL